ncbi:MAG: transcription antitermination factor NusB, partial [Pyrinomonadaceae bacterium]
CEFGSTDSDEATRVFATSLATGTYAHMEELDQRISLRAEHWRIPRMAVVDRNVLRLAVFEFLYESTPRTVTINEALEIVRRFSTYEATQFINGILDAIKGDLDKQDPRPESLASLEISDSSESPESLTSLNETVGAMNKAEV